VKKMILILSATLVVAILSTLTPSRVSAQDGCRFEFESVDSDGTRIKVCADTPRQISSAATAVGSLDRARAASTRTSPASASTSISPAVDAYPLYGFGGQGYGGYYLPPDDPRRAWEIRDAILSGIQVTSFEDQLREASDRGIRDGEHAAEMAAIEGLHAEIERQRSYLAGAIATGNADLERKFAARVADLERQFAAVSAEGGSGSAGKAEPEPKSGDSEDKEPEKERKLRPCTSVQAAFGDPACRDSLSRTTSP